MEKKKGLNEKQEKLFRYYRLVTIWITSFILGLSIWTTMINDIEWTLSDILYQVIGLLIIIISGMFANANNNFSIFHIRGIRITKERLISILMGLFFPVVFLVYIMVTDQTFKEYVSNISLHNFITLSVYSIPVFLIITLIMYFGYLVISPKTKRKNLPQYKEEIEVSLDKHKNIAINLLLLLSFVSIWVKLGFYNDWNLYKILTESLIIISTIAIKIIANKDNKLTWNYSNNKLIDGYFYLTLATPYLLMIVYYILDPKCRIIVRGLGYKNVISALIYILPLFILCALILTSIIRLNEQCKKKLKIKKEIRITNKMAKRNENILTSIAITSIFVLLFFIYIITEILTSINLEILLQIWTILIPLSVIIYIVIYYSIKDINK